MKRPQAQTVQEIHPPIREFARDIAREAEQLVNRALSGDAVAESTIYRQHVRFLLNLATRLTQSVSDGDDLVQDTFVIAFRKLHTLDNPAAMRQWLTRILISQNRRRGRLKWLRAFILSKPEKSDVTLQMYAVYDARPDLRAELMQLDDKLRHVPNAWRTVWMLHRIEGMSIHETAQAASCSLSTVKRYVAKVDKAVQGNKRPAS